MIVASPMSIVERAHAAASSSEIKGEPASKDGMNGLTVHDVKKL